jgi:hypothetical protein
MTRRFLAWLLAVALPTALLGVLIGPATAAPKKQQRGEIFIASDADFDREHGIRSGKGTRRSPYVIANWDVSSITIKDTSKYLVIRNNTVSNQLVLDWNGNRLNVHHNDIGDLRVNQNVPRKGEVTDGRIHHNDFGIVGQLRHWDGVFERNTIGSNDVLAGRGAFKAMQVDGFNGSKLRNNKIFGYVDVKLHGHHHGSSFGKSSHYHGGEGYGDHMPADHQSGVDHTKRYHRVDISNNNITSDNTYALRYYDQAHTGDDRTNASETNKFLNCPHVHFTRASIKGNQLKGGGIAVDVFNAFDENHWGTKRGRMDIRNNRISLDRDVEDLLFSRSGITVQQAVDIDLNIIGNRIFGPNMVEEGDVLNLEGKLNKGAGINLLVLDKGRVKIMNNLVTSRGFGVLATQFTKSVRWWVKGLKTADVEKAVQYDDSVKNPPNQG